MRAPYVRASSLVLLVSVACAGSAESDESSTEDGIRDACEAYWQTNVDCGFEEELEPATGECVASLTATHASNPACSDADVALYACLAEAPCEAAITGDACQAEIQASMDACGGGEPETSG